ncbi:MAG: SAM-dependent methyltransferase [Treponema sp.]|nr:SAM-dependent methyltransferase [Treponema sp.]
MIISVTFSKPAENCEQVLGKDFIKVRIFRNAEAGLSSAKKTKLPYSAEFFTKTQAFQKSMTEEDVNAFIDEHAGKTFKNVVQKTDSQEINFFCNRRGEVKKSVRNISNGMKNINLQGMENRPSGNRAKNYILKEGSPIPFLVHLGLMTKDGSVIASKYAKFRQINRFLEYVRDILPDVKKLYGKDFSRERPLRIADFGCGKSYLTFAVYYYLWQLEQSGYSVQVLEFIDMEHTPKNILLRAVRKRNAGPAKDGCVQSDGLEDNAAEKQINASVQKSRERLDSLLKTLGASQSLCGLLES